jgi:hypothetical protein
LTWGLTEEVGTGAGKDTSQLEDTATWGAGADRLEVTVYESYKGKVKTHKQTKSVNNRKTVKTVMTLTWYRPIGLALQ